LVAILRERTEKMICTREIQRLLERILANQEKEIAWQKGRIAKMDAWREEIRADRGRWKAETEEMFAGTDRKATPETSNTPL
jgi:hypothetical protein